MGESENEVIALDGQESAILNKQGWFLLTYYQTKDEPIDSRAHSMAMQKAACIERKAGLRIYKKDEYTVFEVWEHW